jgi:hypothetical protein
MIEEEKFSIALEYEQYFRKKISDEIRSLSEFNGNKLESIIALLWIKKCADIAEFGKDAIINP